MTKAEQRKILDQIDALIKSADSDSYIADTFAGVVNICRSNIDNDFADYPVQDLELERERFNAEVRMHEQTKKDFSEYRASTEKVLDDMTEELTMWKNNYSDMCKTADEWEQNAHDSGEMYCGLEAECAELSAENRKLKAEIVRMRYERMTEDDMATMYDRMNEED